jgi:hypothetical protein
MPSPTPVVIVESVSPSFRILHTNFEVIAGAGCQVSRGESVTDSGDPVPVVLAEVLGIPGVETVVGRPYGIGVHKAFAFAWGPIEQRVVSLLEWMGENLPVALAEVDLSNAAPADRAAADGEALETPA